MNRKIEYGIGETIGDVFTEFYTELDSFIFPWLSLMNTLLFPCQIQCKPFQITIAKIGTISLSTQNQLLRIEMPPLTNKKFITELGRMSNYVNYIGAISITFKRCLYSFSSSFIDNADVNCFPSKKKAKPDVTKNRCLVRAVSPRKKISTIASHS